MHSVKARQSAAYAALRDALLELEALGVSVVGLGQSTSICEIVDICEREIEERGEPYREALADYYERRAPHLAESLESWIYVMGQGQP